MSKPSIPAWQRARSSSSESDSSNTRESPREDLSTQKEASKEAPSKEAAKEESALANDATEPGQGTLLEQAARFLEDPSIKDAPRERKVAFLESKGIEAEDIAKLLGPDSSSRPTASGPTSPVPASTTSNTTSTTTPSSSPSPTLTPHTPTSTTRSVARSDPPPARDVPPIITYPEFLTTPTKPPPLVTVSRLLNTAYATAAIYGLAAVTSRFMIAPMAATLAERRHEYATHALEGVQGLNEKLEGMVTRVPAEGEGKRKPKRDASAGGAEDDEGDDEDTESEDEDPEELFHRDFGTQTTPTLLSRRGSAAGGAAVDAPQGGEPESETPSVADAHSTRLSIMGSHLSELLSGAEAGAQADSSAAEALSDLDNYLAELTYVTPHYSNGYGGGYGGSGGAGQGAKEKDAIEAFKAEIRGVKGVLLSARNFPAGGRGLMGWRPGAS
ncbi:peroxisomal membrane anchor protein conserved region-domain-containing protein [Lineolata rhizophorae]|uniref:Peroxisomal membrane protein PEX14 n=1 Tax=Lineolata rhizophorae TaxID=578093 RepID=A0A6A6P960_9PEZI|nr:peroxisomal membrane anchor protein conserved region-domain-containing protein [Lineolata rhizophorae]